MNHDQNNHESDTPYYPSGYSPEPNEREPGDTDFLSLEKKSYLGPIPSPEYLEYYHQILPDAPDRILRMAEQNAQNFRELNKRHLEGLLSIENNRHWEVFTGQISGLLAVAAMAAVAIVALAHGYPTVAGTICSITVIGVATVFVTGRRAQSKTDKDGGEQ